MIERLGGCSHGVHPSNSGNKATDCVVKEPPTMHLSVYKVSFCFRQAKLSERGLLCAEL